MKQKRNLLQSFKSALAGVAYCFKTQRNFRIHLVMAALVLIAARFLKISRSSFLILFFGVILVIVLEMINTAFEAIVDLLSPVWRKKARTAKDVAAAAVLLAAVGVLIIGLIVFSF